MARTNQTTRQEGAAALAYIEKHGRAATWHIAGHLKIKTKTALMMMKVLQAQGAVVKSERYGDTNNYVWELPEAKVGAAC